MPQTYSEFIAAIPDYARDVSSELAAQAPSILNLAENRLQRDVDAQAFNTVTVTTPFVAGQFIYNFPTDMVYVNYLQIIESTGVRRVLQKKTLEYMSYYWENPTAQATTSQVRYWDWYNSDSFMVAGTPGSGDSYIVNYKQKILPLSLVNPTNWLTDRANDALLAACIIEAALYKDDPELLGMWRTRYAEAVQALNSEYLSSERDANQVPTFNADNQAATSDA